MDDASTPGPTDPATAWVEPPGMAKALTRGVALGVCISFVGVGGAFLAAGQSWATSIGMGAFVAVWGGLGFGGMMGGVVWASRVEASAERESLGAHDRARGLDGPTAPASAPSGDRVEGSRSRPGMVEVGS
jgi:hypothetical protein